MFEDKAVINIAKKKRTYSGGEYYGHLCKVVVDYYPECETHAVLKLMRKKFPVEEGYWVMETLWQCRGTEVEEEK